jgi:hypothetical protein
MKTSLHKYNNHAWLLTARMLVSFSVGSITVILV